MYCWCGMRCTAHLEPVTLEHTRHWLQETHPEFLAFQYRLEAPENAMETPLPSHAAALVAMGPVLHKQCVAARTGPLHFHHCSIVFQAQVSLHQVNECRHCSKKPIGYEKTTAVYILSRPDRRANVNDKKHCSTTVRINCIIPIQEQKPDVSVFDVYLMIPEHTCPLICNTSCQHITNFVPWPAQHYFM